MNSNNTTKTARDAGISQGSVDAWTSRMSDPRSRFISTLFPEEEYRAFEKAYDDSYRATMRLIRSGR